ncbi:hypothetical protein, partial [Bosea sp. Leaf344]|uniref:hypothetical protein n=1 Tax=Bosea sp. Leaf344 TaxID=1736346 RepID=UPI001AEC3F8C
WRIRCLAWSGPQASPPVANAQAVRSLLLCEGDAQHATAPLMTVRQAVLVIACKNGNSTPHACMNKRSRLPIIGLGRKIAWGSVS